MGYFLHRKLRNYIGGSIPEFCDLSLGELFAGLFFLGILLVQLFSFYNRGLNVYRALGEVNFVTLAFVLLPTSKHSIWLPILGISFERAIKFHRFWGALTLYIMAAHGFSMWGEYSMGKFHDGGLAYALAFPKNAKGWSNLSGFLSWLFGFIGMVVAFQPIRRRFFELFYFVHILCAPLVFIFAGLHMPGLLKWMYPAIALCGLDVVLRTWMSYTKTGKITKVKVVTLSSENTRITKLEVTVPPKKFLTSFQPGQYFFLTIPSINMFVSHPFSCSDVVTSSAAGDVISFHIKDMGSGTWTSQLPSLVEGLGVQIDGPFGSPYIALEEYSSLVLYCGGIGCTPIMSLLADISQAKLQQVRTGGNSCVLLLISYFYEPFLVTGPSPPSSARVDNTFLSATLLCLLPAQYSVKWSKLKNCILVWTSRDVALFEEFMETVGDGVKAFGGENMQLYNTAKGAEDVCLLSDDKDFKVHLGRPKIMDILTSVVTQEGSEPGRYVGVFGCGPEAMLEDVRASVSTLQNKGHGNVHLHTEVFEF
jgi:predicted ferric reductase